MVNCASLLSQSSETLSSEVVTLMELLEFRGGDTDGAT
jgi:hypothetical protein